MLKVTLNKYYESVQRTDLYQLLDDMLEDPQNGSESTTF